MVWKVQYDDTKARWPTDLIPCPNFSLDTLDSLNCVYMLAKFLVLSYCYSRNEINIAIYYHIFIPVSFMMTSYTFEAEDIVRNLRIRIFEERKNISFTYNNKPTAIVSK